MHTKNRESKPIVPLLIRWNNVLRLAMVWASRMPAKGPVSVKNTAAKNVAKPPKTKKGTTVSKASRTASK